MRQSHKTILIWAILILMFVSIYSMFTDSSSKEKEIDVTAFRGSLGNSEEASKIAMFTHFLFLAVYEMPTKAAIPTPFIGEAAEPYIGDLEPDTSTDRE